MKGTTGLALTCLLALACLPALALPPAAASAPGKETPTPDVPALVAAYLERYFATFPSRATAAGRHDFDDRLEDLGPEARRAWVAFNRETAVALAAALARPDLPFEDRLDAELVRRQAELERFDGEVLRRPERDPLFWTGLAAEATVFLLVREDLPADQRLTRAAGRARLLPRLAGQARTALVAGAPGKIAPEICRLAAGQARASARFYREGFPAAGEGRGEALRREMAEAGTAAAAALEGLADFLEGLAGKATGSPRLGGLYGERFRRVAGVEEPVAAVLAQAEAALADKRREAAAYGRSVWGDLFPDSEPPADDAALLRRLFQRVAADHAASVEEFEADFRRLVAGAQAFVRRRRLLTLPDALPLHIGPSPAFFVGQSVGGVYPAGPYAPEAETLFFLPAPPAGATAEEREAFFRDFNHPFNVMITPHEIIPGHALQLALAARHPRKVRALFADGVYVEGWGTFCERLMLDLGWGDPLARLAHLKKQMENIARTVVDVRVHTRGMSREEVLAYVREEALQDEQFAANMWVRALTSSPQLTTYWLGYQQVWGLYQEVKAARGEAFRLRDFMDGMMELGPVPVRHYRERLLAAPNPAAR